MRLFIILFAMGFSSMAVADDRRLDGVFSKVSLANDATEAKKGVVNSSLPPVAEPTSGLASATTEASAVSSIARGSYTSYNVVEGRRCDISGKQGIGSGGQQFSCKSGSWTANSTIPKLSIARHIMRVKMNGNAYAPHGCVITGTNFKIDSDDSIEYAYYQCFE